MDALKGKWERTSAENYEELLKLLEVSFLLRKAATVSTPVCEISEHSLVETFYTRQSSNFPQDGGVFSIKQSTTLKTIETKFKLGEEFEETTPDGRDVTTLAALEDGKLVVSQKAKKANQKSTKYVREVSDSGEMICTITVEGSDVVWIQKWAKKD